MNFNYIRSGIVEKVFEYKTSGVCSSKIVITVKTKFLDKNNLPEILIHAFDENQTKPTETKYYSQFFVEIEIVKVDKRNKENKNYVIKIIDNDFLINEKRFYFN